MKIPIGRLFLLQKKCQSWDFSTLRTHAKTQISLVYCQKMYNFDKRLQKCSAHLTSVPRSNYLKKVRAFYSSQKRLFIFLSLSYTILQLITVDDYLYYSRCPLPRKSINCEVFVKILTGLNQFFTKCIVDQYFPTRIRNHSLILIHYGSLSSLMEAHILAI